MPFYVVLYFREGVESVADRIAEAVRAYTVGSAYAEFTEHQKGTLTPGKLADLVMLDRDIFTILPAEIENTRVVLTLMDGQVVYEAG